MPGRKGSISHGIFKLVCHISLSDSTMCRRLGVAVGLQLRFHVAACQVMGNLPLVLDRIRCSARPPASVQDLRQKASQAYYLKSAAFRAVGRLQASPARSDVVVCWGSGLNVDGCWRTKPSLVPAGWTNSLRQTRGSLPQPHQPTTLLFFPG